MSCDSLSFVDMLCVPVEEEKEVPIDTDDGISIATDGDAVDPGGLGDENSDVDVGIDATGPTEAAHGVDAEIDAVVDEIQLPKTKIIKVKRKGNVERSTLMMSVDRMLPSMHERSTVLLMRSTDGDIPAISGAANSPVMNAYLELNFFNGDMLYGIANLINNLYLPSITRNDTPQVQQNRDDVGDSDEGELSLMHELSSNISNFEQQLRHVVQQSRGDVRLNIPAVVIKEVSSAARDYFTVEILEKALEEWMAVVANAVEAEHHKDSAKEHRSPLAEIEFWRERTTTLSALYEQINMPKVQQMLEVLQLTENVHLVNFNYHFGELSKLFLEAKDNVKFLSTLERHFKHITEGSFQAILDSLPSMVNGLRMVWVISRHYNTDERMAPLMENIAETITKRVKSEVKLSSILVMDAVRSTQLISEAKEVLEQWSENYYQMRKRIEESGSDHRWEFDRKALFSRTDRMAEVCSNFLEIIGSIDRFRKFLGPELKAVTGDSAGIDEILKLVENLIVSLRIPYEEYIFEKQYEDQWEGDMAKFRGNVTEINSRTETFIKESFKKLRSAEGAFELIQSFHNIDTGGGGGQVSSEQNSLKRLISDRYKDILEQYVRELDTVMTIFSANRERPPIYKNFPPLAGAVSWARDLYHRAKRPILRFKKHGGLLDDAFGETVKEKYLAFARSVDAYISELYNDWEHTVGTVAVEKLRQPVLKSIAATLPDTGAKPEKEKSVGAENKDSNAASVSNVSSKGDKDKDKEKDSLPPPPYRVSFSAELQMIIRESRYLDKLGFRIPESALTITLQDAKYHDINRRLSSKLHEYDNVMASLKPIERQLLKSQIEDLNAVIKVGFYPLNWTSQRIPAYIEDLDLALVRFSSVVSQLHKNASMIDEIVEKIASTVLVVVKDFRESDGNVKPMDISEFYETMEMNRVNRLESLVLDYDSIGESFLMKLEEVIAKTTTGCSSILSLYYHYWERRIYNALSTMIIGSMAGLSAMLQCKDFDPFVNVTVSMNGKELVLSPSLTEIDKVMMKAVRNIAESAKHFIRWMHGTCLKTEPQVISDDEEPVLFTYYQDISQNPEVLRLTLAMASQTTRVLNMSNKYLDGWRRYDKVQNLWNAKRKQQVDKLRPTCVNLDQAMSHYEGVKDTVLSQPVSKDIEFVRIDLASVATGVAKQAEVWKFDYGEILLATSRAILTKLLAKIETYEIQIQAETKDLEQLKFLLNVITQIQEETLDTELVMLDITERYRTLARYSISIPDEELESAMTIEKRWKKLYIDARTRDLRLIDTKDTFRGVTQQQDTDFRNELNEMRKTFLDSGPGVSSVDLDTGVDLMRQYKRRVAAYNKTKAELVNAQTLFNLDVKPYPVLQQMIQDLEQLDKIYALYTQFKEFQQNMANMMWGDLDISVLQKGAEDLEKSGKRMPKELRELYTYKMVEGKLSSFRESLPLVVNLKNDAMKPRHWARLMEITGVTFDVSLKTLTLSNIFDMNLSNYTAAVEELINEASQEAKIENELNKIDATWRSNSLGLGKYKKDGQDRGYVLRPAEDIKLELDDNMLNLQTISGSRFVGIFVDRVRKWEKALNIVSECLEIWFVVQRKWMYLEGIFVGAEDIRLQLPEEAKKFDAIDKAYKSIMTSTSKNPNVVDACTLDNRLDVLNKLSDRLDSCQKSLSDYLDTKRAAFPRFFFISDDELLSVLGSSDPSSIQVHMLKLFDNVKAIQFGRNNKIIEGMSSVEKEGFNCKTPSPVEGAVESWMTSFEDEMHASLLAITKEGVFNYANLDRTEWLKQVLGMVGLVGSQIWWTWEVEDTFRQVLDGNKYAMKELEMKLTGQLNELVAMVRDNLDSITRKKVNTLLIIDVHARDIVDGFVRESILNAKEFAWESQLRFYWDRDEDNCVIKQCTGKFRYGYEYMGLNGRLVITPLTDRCYMTLTQALTFKLGGSPAGPAGTGKTETVKDLAKSLALPCFVINCGDGLDYKAMGSIFSGLVQVGAWGCFDEFNRINIEVLSVVSAQLRAIQNSLIYDKPTCDMGMGEMTIKRVAGFATCGIFITMNPGYAGRTELPDNLKALFRPVTMIVPDFLQICEIMLFSEGFEGAKVLAKKMTVLFKLSKEQLSKQYHYDFGMRALKSVLVMAGGLKRQYSDMAEDLVLMRCLRDSNMPKFVFEDVFLFKGLINDLFPGLDCPRVGYEGLKACALQDLESKGFKCSDQDVFLNLADKVIQMFETQLVRHTTMIVGPTGGGKSLILDTLRNARLASENVVVKIHVINPKAQPLHELYGEMDPVTRDWTDGILSKLFRELNEPLPPGKENEVRWILYDGDVDALWVENMNSVMDDNRLLTLPNSERIRLQAHCCMIMETFDLQYASPATISRCGMVWVDPKNLGYTPYYERWVRMRYGNGVTVEESKISYADLMTKLFVKYVPRCIEMILAGIIDGEMGQKLKQVIPITNIDLVKQLCSLLDAFLGFEVEDHSDIEGIYIFCLLWSLGAQLVGDSRIKFDAYLKRVSREALPDGLLYDYFYEPEAHRWEKWMTKVTPYEEPSPFRFYEVMVPTTDSVLYSHILRTVAPFRPVLFVGESGTAKTTVIQKYLSDLPVESYGKLNINFSSRTSAADVQTNIEANVDKRSGTIYGPSGGKKLIVFIDDMNMPKVDTYGTQQPIALLLFLMGRGNIYDRGKDLSLKTLKDLQYIGAMGPPGGGRNPVDTRYIALFNVFNLTPPTAAVLDSIYSSIINTRFSTFNDSVKGAATKFPGALLKLYNFVVDKMPPTPAKFHYIFNLRDLSRVCEGLCCATPDIFDKHPKLVRLFRNECDRIFSDRLASSEDQKLFLDQLSAIVKENFPDCVESAMKQPCLFGDFENALERIQSDGTAEDLRLYKDAGEYDDIRKLFSGVLENYNMENKVMTLVLFEQALEHLTRIHRIIRTPRGNAMLVGVGGSGKQSLTTLAAYTAGYKLFQITLSRGYGETQFKDDLKELYKLLGQGEVVFMFTDAHVVEEGFLEFINNMLTTGMVPALYAQDEKEGLMSSVREEVAAAGIVPSPDNLWNAYVNKCRNNLHIVLAMSPSGSKLRLRCRNFPGLVSNAVIDWFFPWPADALQKVAEFFLIEEALPDEHRKAIVAHLVFAHQNVTVAAKRFADELRRYYYVTPKNYLDFIFNYREQLKTNVKRIANSTKRLEGGLQKLIEAADAVDRMQTVLSEKKVVVDAKTVDVQAMIATIQEKTAVANKQQKQASEKQAYASEQAIIITQQKADADEALMEALPAVEAASRALENLDKSELSELKAFTNPPPAVKNLCLQLVCLRPTGEKLEENWGDAKKMLGNSNLLQLLKTYPKDDITEKQIKKVNKYFNEELTLEKMQSVSKAGYGLLTWVVAIVKYYEVARNVAPLRAKVKEMEKAQRQTEAELAEIQAQLATLSKEIGELNVSFTAASSELDALQSEAALMSKRLAAASKLIDGLTGERTRWSTDVASLGEQKIKLFGDCLLGSSFLSYCGAFTNDFRSDLINNKFLPDVTERKIPLSESFSLEGLLTTDAIVQGWALKGLPGDEHSVQNGILTTKGSRFPLCVDPQEQAITWIKKTYQGKNLTVKSLTASDFMKHLELAIQFGNPFLFENVDEELDPMLDPVLEKNVVKEGSTWVVKLGDKNVEWDENFRLFFCTKLANPHYSPEVMGKTMIINYGVTMDGLANQLLNVVVAHERPDLERMWSDLVTEMGEAAQLIVQLEDTLLRELSSSSGNILDNQDLIATLENTKSKAVEIQGKLEQTKQTKEDIGNARSVYKPVAKRGSILYFAEAGLATINSMYEISLDSFLFVFRTALDAAKKDVVLDNRLRNMIETLMRQVYDYTCTGIFERHKLMFSFQMTCMVMDGEGTLSKDALDFFLKGDTSLDSASETCPVNWMSNTGWKDLLHAQTLDDVFVEVTKDFKVNISAWKEWYDLEAPEAVPLPNGFTDKMTTLQRLSIMRCFRPDRVYNAVKLFVVSEVGDKYVQPPVIDYHRIYGQSSPTSPMVFILSPGADPQSDIQKFCDEMGMAAKFKFVALGQGQGPIAEQLLDAGVRRGHWVLLQNCHLLTSWLRNLERMLNEVKDPHPEFRLWLTTDPTDKFPLGILQRSFKVVTEPPDGLKMNMRATYSRIDQATLEDCPHWAFRPCLYVLAFLHAVVLERRKYGKIGWNVSYDFNDSDFNISRRLLGLYLQKSFEDSDEFLPWGSLKYLIGDAMYGGRVSDDMDRRVLKTYLEEYMGDFLFDDCQKFTFSKVGFDYCLPGFGDLENYTSMIESLPLTNSPAVFGLHPNAEIGYYTNAVKSMWIDLISLQPRRAGGGEGMSRDDYIGTTARDIYQKIPLASIDVGGYDLIQTRALLYQRNGSEIITPCQVVLLQELERWNGLIKKMAISLQDLQKALIGEIGMSDELDGLGDSLYNGFLPGMWKRLTPDTQKPLGSWMNHYMRRSEQYENWVKIGEPAVMWLSGLHIPESYLTALVQTTCRARGWPLDKSTLYTVVTTHSPEVTDLEPLESGCYVSGLYLEGAAWDHDSCCLRPQDPKVLVVELPIMQVIPIEASKLKLHNTFKTPVYVTQNRRNAMGVGLVFEADLATHEHTSHWVLQGVSLCLNTDA